MSGHSKWANIKHKKEATDKKKGQAFSRLAKEIMVATKQGGKDPASNINLRMALASAKASNMPRENIERAIKKGAGELGDVAYEEITYEGYGPAGTAFVVECLTENRNRTIGDVRMTFDRNGGNLAASGGNRNFFKHRVFIGDDTLGSSFADTAAVLDPGQTYSFTYLQEGSVGVFYVDGVAALTVRLYGVSGKSIRLFAENNSVTFSELAEYTMK